MHGYIQPLLIEKPAFSLFTAGGKAINENSGSKHACNASLPCRKDVITKYFAFLYLAVHILQCSLSESSSLVSLHIQWLFQIQFVLRYLA